MQLKSYSNNGYKQMNIMGFGEAAKEIINIRVGTIVLIIGPKLLKCNEEHGISFSIDAVNQI
jgi:hypothetical protein